MTRHSAQLGVVIACALWLTTAAGMIFSGALDGPIIADDAFYYFEISRNAARGEGFTFDGMYPTNGFHPLWAWLLTPLFALSPDSFWLPIHLALFTSGMCTVATAGVLFHLFGRRKAYGAGLFAAWFWLLNPLTVIVSFRGLETTLNTLLFAISLFSLDRIRSQGRWRIRETTLLGGLLGLCMLARTENILWTASVCVVLIAELARKGRHRAIPASVGALGLGALVPLLPWLLWNLETFGTLVQTSGLAKIRFELYGALPEISSSSLAQTIQGATRNLLGILEHIVRFLGREDWGRAQKSPLILLALTSQAAAVWLGGTLLRRKGESAPGEAAAHLVWRRLRFPTFLFFALHLGYYAWVAQSYAHWYFLPVVLGLSLWIGERLSVVERPIAAGSRIFVAVGVVASLALTFWIAAPHFKRNDQRLRQTALLASHVDPSVEKLGVWNAGLVGYWFSFHRPDLRVINLDGVVNNQVTALADSDAYENYILETVDAVGEDAFHMTPMVGSERAQRFDARHLQCKQRLGRLRFCRVQP